MIPFILSTLTGETATGMGPPPPPPPCSPESSTSSKKRKKKYERLFLHMKLNFGFYILILFANNLYLGSITLLVNNSFKVCFMFTYNSELKLFKIEMSVQNIF